MLAYQATLTPANVEALQSGISVDVGSGDGGSGAEVDRIGSGDSPLFGDEGLVSSAAVGGQAPPLPPVESTWLVLAVCVLLYIAAAILLSLAMLVHFWRGFREVAWKRTDPAIKAKDVSDPLFRLVSQLKLCCNRLFLLISCQPPPRVPTDEEVLETFKRYDLDGSGFISAHELWVALIDLGVIASKDARDCKAGRTIRAFLKTHDENQDGMLSQVEFIAAVKDAVLSTILLRPVQRIQGKWAKPPVDTKEPARTERLLSQPLRFLRPTASDCQDCMSLNLMGKVSGISFLGLSFAWASMLIQVSCGVVSGLGPYVARGTGAATMQVLAVAFVKLGWAYILYRHMPCVCLLTNSVVTAQVTPA